MHHKRSVFIAACAGMLLFGVCLITMGSVATPLKQKFALDALASGTLFSILPVGILCGSLVFGPVCDRYGYKAILMVACACMFAGFEGIAYAPSAGLLKVFIFVFGFGGGIVNGATNAVVSDISDTRKGANLSLLGVFFGIGALGMPLVLSLVSDYMSPFQVVASIGWLTLAIGLWYAFVKFPPAKLTQEAAASQWRKLFKPLLLLIAFFLFFQSSFEAIINNWTTTYLTSRSVMTESDALFALSLHIVGMVVMRLLTGSVFHKVPGTTIMWACLAMLALGVALMQAGQGKAIVIAGLFLSGAGLAGGFPLMLGFVGERFSYLSGTAFSFVFTIALIGNMLINYLMGIIVHRYGVQHLATVSYIEIGVMTTLFYFIIKKLKTTQ